MSNIEKKQDNIDKLNNTLNELNYNDSLSVGDMFYDDMHKEHIIKISKIKHTKDKITIHYDVNEDWECTEWRSYGSDSIENFIRRYGKIKLKKSVQDYRKEAIDIIEGKKSIDEYKDNSFSEQSSETALMSFTNKDSLKIIEKELEQKKKSAELIRAAIGYEMEIKKRELEKIRSNLGLILADFNKKIDKIQKVIWTIELYLGIQEDIIQIKEGIKASEKEPIVLRQGLLYMDEEVGDVMNDKKGLDFENIEHFDEWLLKYSEWYGKNNYEVLVPEQKCIVAIRVRREDKKYNNNPWINGQLNIENKKTYLLIRNGDNLYRIWGDIKINRLFPKRTELQQLKDKWDELTGEGYVDGGNAITIKDKTYWGSDNELNKIEDSIFKYKQQLILLQGLIDRTDILHPISEPIKLLSDRTIEKGLVKFIYDDEMQISSGRKSFNEYLKDINLELTEGSKVLIVNAEKDKDRYDDRYTNEYRLPDSPDDGVYTVYNKPYDGYEQIWSDEMLEKEGNELSDKLIDSVEYRQTKEYGYSTYNLGQITYPNYMTDDINDRSNRKVKVLIQKVKKVFHQPVIKYNPGGEVRNWWDSWDNGHERKNRISYNIYPKSDRNIINYDLVDIEEIKYYMLDRTNRRNYLTMMPVLKQVYDQKLKEFEKEKQFTRGLSGQFLGYSENIVLPIIEQCIQKFKDKVKWKRSIDDNDEKSWTLIKKMVNRELKKL